MRKPKIVVCRHSYYDDISGSLSREGIEQAKKLAVQIKGKIGHSKKIGIFSSSHRRAVETAQIIKEVVGAVSVQVVDSLRGDTYVHGARAAADILAVQEKYGVLIAVTHYEAPPGLVNALCRKYHQTEPARCGVVEKGTGFYVTTSGALAMIG